MDWLEAFLPILAKFIEKVGFPIFVAVWVLIIQNKELKKLTGAINSLTSALNGDRLISNIKKKGGD